MSLRNCLYSAENTAITNASGNHTPRGEEEAQTDELLASLVGGTSANIAHAPDQPLSEASFQEVDETATEVTSSTFSGRSSDPDAEGPNHHHWLSALVGAGTSLIILLIWKRRIFGNVFNPTHLDTIPVTNTRRPRRLFGSNMTHRPLWTKPFWSRVPEPVVDEDHPCMHCPDDDPHECDITSMVWDVINEEEFALRHTSPPIVRADPVSYRLLSWFKSWLTIFRYSAVDFTSGFFFAQVFVCFPIFNKNKGLFKEAYQSGSLAPLTTAARSVPTRIISAAGALRRPRELITAAPALLKEAFVRRRGNRFEEEAFNNYRLATTCCHVSLRYVLPMLMSKSDAQEMNNGTWQSFFMWLAAMAWLWDDVSAIIIQESVKAHRNTTYFREKDGSTLRGWLTDVATLPFKVLSIATHGVLYGALPTEIAGPLWNKPLSRVEITRESRAAQARDILSDAKPCVSVSLAREVRKALRTDMGSLVPKYPKFSRHVHGDDARARVVNHQAVRHVCDILQRTAGFSSVYTEQMSYGEAQRGVRGSRQPANTTDILSYVGSKEDDRRSTDIAVYTDVFQNMDNDERMSHLTGCPCYAIVTIDNTPSIYTKTSTSSETFVSFDGKMTVTKLCDHSGVRIYQSYTPGSTHAEFIVTHSAEYHVFFGFRVCVPVSAIFLQVSIPTHDNVKLISVYLKMFEMRGNRALYFGNPNGYFFQRFCKFVKFKLGYEEYYSVLEPDINIIGETHNILQQHVVSQHSYVDVVGHRIFREDTQTYQGQRPGYKFVVYEDTGEFACAFTVSKEYYNSIYAYGKDMAPNALKHDLAAEIGRDDHHEHLGGDTSVRAKLTLLKNYCQANTKRASQPVNLHSLFSKPIVATAGDPDQEPTHKPLTTIGNGKGFIHTGALKNPTDVAVSIYERLVAPHTEQTDLEKSTSVEEILGKARSTIPADADGEEAALHKLCQEAMLFAEAFSPVFKQGGLFYDVEGMHAKAGYLEIMSLTDFIEHLTDRGKLEIASDICDKTDSTHDSTSSMRGTEDCVMVEGRFLQTQFAPALVKNENANAKPQRLVSNLAGANPFAAGVMGRVANTLSPGLKMGSSFVYGKRDDEVAYVIKKLGLIEPQLALEPTHMKYVVDGVRHESLPLKTIKLNTNEKRHRGWVDSFMIVIFRQQLPDYVLNLVRKLMDVDIDLASTSVAVTSSADYSKFDASQGFPFIAMFTCMAVSTFGEDTGRTVATCQEMLRNSLIFARTKFDGKSEKFIVPCDGRNPSGSQTTTLDNNLMNLYVQFEAWHEFVRDIFDLVGQECQGLYSVKGLGLTTLKRRSADVAVFLMCKYSRVSGDDAALAVLPFKYLERSAAKFNMKVKLECQPYEVDHSPASSRHLKGNVTLTVSFLCSTVKRRAGIHKSVHNMYSDLEVAAGSDTKAKSELHPDFSTSGITEICLESTHDCVISDQAHVQRRMRGMLCSTLPPTPLIFYTKAIGAFVSMIVRFGPIPGVYELTVCFIILYMRFTDEEDLMTAFKMVKVLEESKHTKGSVAYAYSELALSSISFTDSLMSTVFACIKERGPQINRKKSGILADTEALVARPLISPSSFQSDCNIFDTPDYEYDLITAGIDMAAVTAQSNALIGEAYERGIQNVSEESCHRFLWSEEKFCNELELKIKDPERKNHLLEFNRDMESYELMSPMSQDAKDQVDAALGTVLIEQMAVQEQVKSMYDNRSHQDFDVHTPGVKSGPQKERGNGSNQVKKTSNPEPLTQRKRAPKGVGMGSDKEHVKRSSGTGRPPNDS